MPTAAVSGIQVSYADSGGGGPVVVLSHGFLLDQSVFGARVAALAPEYRVITWGQRGHGRHPGARPVQLPGLGQGRAGPAGPSGD